MLTICTDPAGITGFRRHAWDFGVSIQANIERHLADGSECEVRINGEIIDPTTDPRLDALPTHDDFVIVAKRPAGFETLAIVAITALVVYTYSMIPKIPGTPVVSAESPNNRLTGQTNIARAYQAIPDVYGLRRVWPDLIQPSLVEYIDNVKYITEWLCISRGKGTITSIQYADTPILSFGGASYTIFEPASSPSAYPELNDTTLTDVLEPFPSPEVNGQELNYSTGIADYLRRDGTIVKGAGSTWFDLTFVDAPAFDYMKSIAGAGTVYIERLPLSGSDPYFPETATLLSYTEDGLGNVTFRFDNTALIYAGGTAFATWNMLPAGAPSSSVKGPFILPVECDRIYWNTAFLRGLKGTAEIEVQLWKVDSGGAEIGGTREVIPYSYTADTFDQRFFTDKVTPAAGFGRYAIQFERTNVAEADGSDVAKLEALYAVRYYATKELPGVTTLKVTTQASQGASGAVERKFNLRWNRHVRTFGSTTLSASRNFGRALAHLWCVAGEDIAELDTTALAAINTALGETSDLLRFDGSLDDAEKSLGERMQLIANNARCVVWRNGTQWTVTREQARAAPEMQLDYRNLAARGDSTISYSAHLPASHDGVEVEYVDEVTQSRKAYVRLDISSGAVVAGTSSNPMKMKLPGCATLAQAENRAHLEARRLLYSRTSVQDTALADASQLGVGSLVRWVDPNDFAGDDGLQAGEVLAIAGLIITTSEPLDWHGETTGRVLLTGTDGLYIGSPVLCTPGAAANQVVLASMPAGVFVKSATRQLGSRYAFAVGLTEAEMQAAGLFTVTEVMPSSDRTVSIALTAYDDRLFEED